MRLLLALAALVLASPSRAAEAKDIGVDHEVWSVIGWNDSCGVAFTRLAYPKLGEAMMAEPVMTRAGFMSIAPQKEEAEARWTLESDGALSWDKKAFKKAEKDLIKGGYSRPGYPDVIRDGPIGDQPGLAESILSTATLSVRLKKGWPGPEWRWAAANFNPLGTCALLAFEKRAEPRRYRFLLVRVYNSRARIDRAYAHASNARLLFNAGNLDESAPEAATAAALAPELPIARYEHAAQLALTGHHNEAVTELAAALKLEPKYKEKARTDLDFADLKRRDDFREITR